MIRFIWLYHEINLIKKRQIGADLQNHEKQLFFMNFAYGLKAFSYLSLLLCTSGNLQGL